MGFFEVDGPTCRICGKKLGKMTKGDLCRRCEEEETFKKIRDYIRDNDVTEREVAQAFNIPRETLREWIKSGRIEYRK